MNRIYFIFLLIIILGSSSCEKEEDSLYMIISPREIRISATPRDVIPFIISCESPEIIREFKITSKLDNDFSTTLLDSTDLGSKRIDYTFEYKVPSLIEPADILMVFRVDNGKEVLQIARTIVVEIEQRYLEETSGHLMYSAFSDKADAYSISTGSPLFTSIADSSAIEIRDVSSSDTLSRRWVTQSGLKFVKFNGFDYANSTVLTLKQSFESGIKYDFVDDITANDIILVQLDSLKSDSSFAAIFIDEVYDEDGSQNDRYKFSIKK